MDFEIQVLGPVEFRTPGHRDPLGSPKERLLLASLAVDAGRPISLDTLVDRMWEVSLPKNPRANLHSYAARIRKRFTTACAPAEPPVLAHEAHTYTLGISPDAVDCHRFQRLGEQARSLSDSGDDAGALRLFEKAASLWQGEPLAGLAGQWVQDFRAVWEERRLDGTLARIGVELRLGRFAEVVGELTVLAAQHPTDETLIGHLMVASYGRGRQGDALRVYDAARHRLSEEFGTDPGESLARIYRLILDHSPVSAMLPGRMTSPTAPNNLPSHGELVGREEEMRLLQTPPPDGAVIAIQAIAGMAGVGKSLLALHAARQLSSRYPDGQVHLKLNAHTAGQGPMTPETALSTLLRIFGVPATDIPHGVAELTARWRTLLNGRRAVIVLDDASGAEQLSPLLPGNSTSLIIITSRRQLVGVPGVWPVFLDVLPPEDAMTLFEELVGAERTETQTDISDIVRLCGYLPLAIELAAGRLISRPTWNTAYLIKRLTRGHGRLSELRNESTGIVQVFDMSYRTLTPNQRRVFRFLGLHLGPEFDPHSTAALTGFPLAEIEQILESLLESHLIKETSPERFRLHDLLGEYARTLVMAEHPDTQREAAVGKLVDFLLFAAHRADRLLYPRHPRLDPQLTHTDDALPHWQEPADAKQWLTSERPALIAAERHARSHGAPHTAARLAHVLSDFLNTEGYWHEVSRMHHHAAEYWKSSGNQRAEIRALIDLSSIQSHSGPYDQADQSARRALSLADSTGDLTGKAEALRVLGILYLNLGQLSDSLSFKEAALELQLKRKDAWEIARSHNNLGVTLLALGDREATMTAFSSALSEFVKSGDRRGEAQARNNLGDLLVRKGEMRAAHTYYQESLKIILEVGSRTEQAIAQLNLASLMSRKPDQIDAALDLYREALFAFRQTGDRRNEAATLNAIGEAFCRAQKYAESSAHHEAALDAARRIGASQEEAQALRGAGLADLRSGRYEAARGNLLTALSLARRIHAAEEESRIQEALAELHTPRRHRAAGRTRS